MGEGQNQQDAHYQNVLLMQIDELYRHYGDMPDLCHMIQRCLQVNLE